MSPQPAPGSANDCSILYVATLVTALGCGLIAGIFFASSSFVMAALKRLPTAEGIAAMQSINRLAVTPASAVLGALVLLSRERFPEQRDQPVFALCGVLWFGLCNVVLNAAERLVVAGTAAMRWAREPSWSRSSPAARWPSPRPSTATP